MLNQEAAPKKLPQTAAEPGDIGQVSQHGAAVFVEIDSSFENSCVLDEYPLNW